jgi:hypothetical protein
MSLCSFIMVFLLPVSNNGGGISSNTNSENPLVGENSSNLNTAISQNPLTGTWVSGDIVLRLIQTIRIHVILILMVSLQYVEALR